MSASNNIYIIIFGALVIASIYISVKEVTGYDKGFSKLASFALGLVRIVVITLVFLIMFFISTYLLNHLIESKSLISFLALVSTFLPLMLFFKLEARFMKKFNTKTKDF